jgi:hypothetical protein
MVRPQINELGYLSLWEGIVSLSARQLRPRGRGKPRRGSLRQPFRKVLEHFFCDFLDFLFILGRFFGKGIGAYTPPYDPLGSYIEQVDDKCADIIGFFLGSRCASAAQNHPPGQPS